MDTFVTIEGWDSFVGGWQLRDEAKNLTDAMHKVSALTNEDLLVSGEHGLYRIVETKIVAIWENGNEIAPTEKLRHRGCSL